MTPTDQDKLESFVFADGVSSSTKDLRIIMDRILGTTSSARNYFAESRNRPDQEDKWNNDAQGALYNLRSKSLVDPDGPEDGPMTMDLLEKLMYIILGDDFESKVAAIVRVEAEATSLMSSEELGARAKGLLISAYNFRNYPTPEESLESRMLDGYERPNRRKEKLESQNKISKNKKS